MAGPRTPKARAILVADRLAERYPGGAAELCALTHDSPYQLLAATILSAQCTDERVNMVTPVLFARYPTAVDLAGADARDVEEIVRSTGFFRAKTQSLIGMAQAVVHDYGGEVPEALEDLVKLPGVGRKTGNVLRSVAYGLPGLPVDTHVGRIARRLKLTVEQDPVKVERDLCSYLAPARWGDFSIHLILLGREICTARKPRCGVCPLADICPSAGKVEPATSGATRRRSVRAVGTRSDSVA
jgi:endonuclease-3